MKTRDRLREIARAVVVAIVYLVSAKVGLSLAFEAPQSTPIWPPAGVALAAYLLYGARVAPGIYVGAFVANVTTDEPLLTAAAIALGNTVAWLVAARLLRVARFDRALERLRDVLAFVCIACVGGAMIAATNGAIQLALGGQAPWSRITSVWLVWWVGDTLGALIVAPVAITWTAHPPLSWRRRGELVLLLITTVGVSYAVLVQSASPSKYVVFPVVLWAALRFRQRAVALTVLAINTMAVWTVVHGRGPFTDTGPLGMQLLFLDAFMAVVAITGLVVGAVVSERFGAQNALRLARDRLGVLVLERTAELTKANRELARAQEIAHLGSWQWTLSVDQVTGSCELYRILDVDPTNGPVTYADVIERVHPGDRERVERIVAKAMADKQPMTFEFRLNESGDRVRTLLARGEVETDDGQVIGLFGTVEDVTEARHAQRAIERSLKEKEVLLKEIHHRVKNNLQVITSLVNLQASAVPEPHMTALLQETNARVYAIALVHEHLYQTENLASIDATRYLKSLTTALAQSFDAAASVECSVEDIELTIETAIPCGLIVTELVSNAFKHAFPNRRYGNVVVSLTRARPHHLVLEVRDDGIGMPPEIDIKTTKTMGLQVVQGLAAQLDAVVEVERQGGTTFRLRFPRAR